MYMYHFFNLFFKESVSVSPTTIDKMYFTLIQKKLEIGCIRHTLREGTVNGDKKHYMHVHV